MGRRLSAVCPVCERREFVDNLVEREFYWLQYSEPPLYSFAPRELVKSTAGKQLVHRHCFDPDVHGTAYVKAVRKIERLEERVAATKGRLSGIAVCTLVFWTIVATAVVTQGVLGMWR